MEQRLFTIEQIREQFLISSMSEAIQSIATAYREAMTQEDAAKMLAAIFERTEKHASQYPEEAAALKEWSPMDRLLWAVKEAYVMGAVDGFKKVAQSNQMGVEALEKGTA